jgi:threonine/homoserine/homoserine lactone efflux protein
MNKNLLKFEELKVKLIAESNDYSVKTLKTLIFLTQLVKFLNSKFFLFIVTIIPFFILMWMNNFNVFLSSIILSIHLVYWVIISMINYKFVTSDETRKLTIMIEIYNKQLLEKLK